MLLEPEYSEDYAAWKESPGPESNARILRTLQPLVERTAQSHVGDVNPLVLSHARRMTLSALGTYDPAKARLSTHLFNQLQGLRRVVRKQHQVLKVPERIALERQHLDQATSELRHELGREPTDRELSDRTGIGYQRLARVRSYRPAAAEGAFNEETGIMGHTRSPGVDRGQLWRELVYEELDPIDQKIMEHAFGLFGRAPLSNQAIAARLNRSPGAISQRKARIQALLDREDRLSPFGR